jgi:GH24 family phage-related lysozyme (muramidase)
MATTPTPRPIKNNRLAIASLAACAIAIPAEGLRQTFYYDPPGIATVCYGSTHEVDKNKVYSIEECKARLDTDMMSAVTAVDKCHPGLPDSVLAAFADAVYNIGPKVACDNKNSTASRLLNAKDYPGACNQLVRWDKAVVLGVTTSLPGLTRRRLREKELCLSGLQPQTITHTS